MIDDFEKARTLAKQITGSVANTKSDLLSIVSEIKFGDFERKEDCTFLVEWYIRNKHGD